MISYEAPPRLSAESIVAGKTLKALLSSAASAPVIDLLCASPGDEVPVDESLEDLLPDTLRVHRIDPLPRGRKTILQRIIGGKGGWQKEAAIKATALFPAEHKKPGIIYSRSHPPASHLVALDLVAGPMQGVPWVAHFSDPWSQHAYYRSPVTRAALARYETKIMDAASRIIFVSDTLRDTMLANAPAEVKAKARVIPHPFDASLYAKAFIPEPLRAETPGVRRIAHVGDLYGLRSPATLFEAFGKLLKAQPQLPPAELWLVGRMDPAFAGLDQQHGLNSRVKQLAPVPYFQSLSVMAAADVLLAVEAPVKNSVFFPSKLVDYLGARKPIFAITPKGGQSTKLMDAWKQPWCDVNDIDGIAAVLKRIAEGDLWPAPDAQVLETYSASTIGTQVAAVFKELRANVRPTGDGGADQQAQA
jgi:hypothetical protein